MTTINADLLKDLKKSDLRYVSDENPGFTRKKNGSDFKYFDKKNHVIKSGEALERIKSLAIPPAWKNVWICPVSTGYLQAIGFDDRDRKQYIYHPDWVALSQQNKFHKLLFFGKVLPEIRKKINSDMISEALDREKIIATVIWLLEHTFIRVGNEEYAKDNDSFGLTTLRNKHVTVRGKDVKFEFRGKSGVEHSIKISHPRIARIIKECTELPGYEIFKYIDDSNIGHLIDSHDVNEYLKAITGEDITAKDFRTWGGTVMSGSTLYGLGPFESEEAALNNIKKTVILTAKHLGNTVKICQNYYIHPKIIESYKKKILIPHFERVFRSSTKSDGLTKHEYAVMTLLQG